MSGTPLHYTDVNYSTAELINASAYTEPRHLVANDFNADFSRRLSFHNWVEEDVILDRVGLEHYLRRALSAAGLARKPGRASMALQNTIHRPHTTDDLQHEFSRGKFSFDTAYAAQAHRLLSSAPWSQGRDEFMRLVRYGLRPNHYFLELGCGPLATGSHLVRYLLTGRYFCLEQDEYLLRAAVEYEIPSAGLIHKKPHFLMNDLAEVATLMTKPAGWLSDPPSYFDFVLLQRSLLPDHLERTITNAVRHLRPRSGRLMLMEQLPLQLQLRLGLQPAAVDYADSKLEACPFSLKCTMYAYHT